MLNILFLDDDPYRQKWFKSMLPSAVCVWTAEDAIAELPGQQWDFVFLDHDLGGEAYVDSKRPDTGMEVARWLRENQVSIATVVLHSMNPAGRANMKSALEPIYFVLEIPFNITTLMELFNVHTN
jgi:CheY-like chemotaxis protein